MVKDLVPLEALCFHFSLVSDQAWNLLSLIEFGLVTLRLKLAHLVNICFPDKIDFGSSMESIYQKLSMGLVIISLSLAHKNNNSAI